ncbi:MAG TPA: glycoside hydrolase family 15 protein [Planctomycetaceae bacterium]|nr:glycoside hydrolase family 15 protein [Planctomycetaceae bacterium]
MAYQPIENYGLIGNLQTAALVGMNGSIDWLCVPRFDSPSVFAAILDDQKGGRFRIAPPEDGLRLHQHYWPNTNILVTRFLHPDGIGELVDYMPVGGAGGSRDELLVRRVRVVHGQMPFRLECRPAFDYARAGHDLSMLDHGCRFDGPGLSLGLAGSVPLRRDGDGVASDFVLGTGESTTFVLRRLEAAGDSGPCPGSVESEERFRETVTYWQRWLSHCTYQGRWREVVHRSALVLKLLTYEPSGAVVAAPTTSLPEHIGGVRNWDYRYAWLRDASFTLYALMRIGFTEEAARFMSWLEDRWHDDESAAAGPLQLMYGIDGRTELPEEELPHLEGYRGSRPVRIGNGAYDQLQLDIYGELMDSAYLFNKYGTPIGYDAWKDLSRVVDWVSHNWAREDEGIWEVRGGRRHFVYSRLMCWVALDRGLRLAAKRSFPADRARWLRVRDEIYEEIMQQGWDPQRRAFVQAYGSSALDASNLLMPLVFFAAPNDPRMLATIDAIRQPLEQGGLSAGSLVYRYDPLDAPDGLAGSEGTFNMCSFWLVEALTRAGRTDSRRLEEARLLFEEMLGYANHLGLYAEQTGYQGEALGNFPQAFTHLALISAAFNLDRILGGGRAD